MHAFVHKDLTSQANTYEMLLRRLRFLKDKLIADLQSRDKIFVYAGDRQLERSELFALHAAVCGYGSNTLLCVCPRRGNQVPGHVEIIADGLLAGCIDRLGYDGKRWDVSFDCWLELCQQAIRASGKA